MAIAYRAGSTAGGGFGTNLTVNKPTGTADGDILLAVTYREGGSWTLPSGWAWVDTGTPEQVNGAANAYVGLAWKRASSEGSSWTFNLSSNVWRIIAIGAWSGAASSGDPWDVASHGNSGWGTTAVVGAITTTVANTMRVVATGSYSGASLSVGSSGMTKRAALGGTEFFEQAQASAGSSGTETLEAAAGTGDGSWWHIALKESSGGSPQTINANAISSGETVYQPAVTMGALTVSPNAIASAATVYQPALTFGAITVSPNAITSTAQVFQPAVSVGGLIVAPNLIASAETVYQPALTFGAITISPNVIASAETVYQPAVLQGQQITPNLIASAETVYQPALTMGAITISPVLIASTATVYQPAIGNPIVNWHVLVGNGYSDVSPKQLVRTSGNILYTVAANCDSYPDLSANGLTQTIRVHKANSTGVPTGFTRKDSSNEPAAVISWAAALDSDDNIRIVWAARSSLNLTRYLRYAVFDTSTDTWGSVTTIASDLDFDDIGQNHQTVALVVDGADVCHIVYLGTAGNGTDTNRRLYYRNNSGGSWSAATQIDTGVSYTDDHRAWNPNLIVDEAGRRWVTWERGQLNANGSGSVYSRVYSGGSWGDTVLASASGDSLEVGIDQGTSQLITPDGRWHIAHILHNTTHPLKYIRYRYSDDQGATWTGNNPTIATHDPSLAWTGSKVRIYGHGEPNESNYGANVYYMEGDGGSGTWGAWTQIVTGSYDSSVNTRWSVYHFHYSHTQDVIYWSDSYPTNLYAGTEILALDIAPDAIASTAQVFAPTVSQGQTIQPDAIASTATVYQPAVTAGAITVSVNAIAGSAQVFAPALTFGAITVSVNAIASTATVYQPTVLQGGALIEPNLIASTATVYQPALTFGAITVSPNRIDSAATVYQPAVLPGVIVVNAEPITSTAQVYAVTVTIGALTVYPALIDSAAQVFPPTVSTGGVILEPNMIASVAQVFTPALVMFALVTAAERTYTVPADSRTYTVPADSRIYTVEA